ncbi:MAG: hypothetical protein A3I07_01290 [Candidatus Doudnabacteria bacterium RIFCSPLOWO2_02_FULL_42_9]|uniref:Uncharacterized protein n=1 Tax=Candidatus Doudnabacteria bacterium RIFCSPHIGHO2_01_FULL_41_86 TaxID=1817821 RepID=A0A1F5N8U5_9BACT|nr:MAG: hypothetical protein A2717_00850 [Candidatus Doudnabacteria bacterium RIFCSPHIGHO2_01_FULL_41_86]OGE75391.1 MAG: hypothetical protein A3K07_01365 [Candidatus Doudnabacteria bacterium RIFCSPHIGHO2_01_43_10]OGE86583.1 MAG: hypothetical protein A3E28_04205 [Candidatus Doudnabacteria bacterium RIFCSPHIGHO2_12_FULL_42_22]OGE87483.1 MAG: hypothetical protein A3C49_03865 [Candidatus Doudnabacteria bacterium RIFCSPHIGHO2_02_FULL_42_25]OGE92782.1 MAG: hypothetical protein A2895_04650 [Candidatus
MTDINLLQSQIKDTTVASTQRTSMFVTLVVIIFIALVAGNVLLYLLTKTTEKQTAEVLEENNELQISINKVSKELDAAKSLQAKLANASMLLEKHTLTTPLLEELEKYTFIKSRYFAADFNKDNNKIHLEGNVPTYTDLGKLILGLSTSENFQNVKLLSVSDGSAKAAAGSGKVYSFSIDMNVIPKIYTK